MEELNDAAECEAYYGAAQLSFLYEKLTLPRDLYVVARGSPGFSGGSYEHTDSYLWCPKERGACPRPRPVQVRMRGCISITKAKLGWT